MILIILILAVIAFIYFNVIPKKGYMPLAIISLLIAVLSIAGIVAHDYNHYGMDKDKVVGLPIAVGGGTVKTAHGIIPVPAPASIDIPCSV